MELLPSSDAVSGGFEVRMSPSGVPVICRKAEPKWAEETEGSAAGAGKEASGRVKTRMTKAHGDRIENAGAKIGGAFERAANPSWLKDRVSIYDEIIAAQHARLASKPRVPINITLPNGNVITGTSWETTPLQVAEGISKSLAKAVVVGKVVYTGPRAGLEAADGAAVVNTGPEEDGEEGGGEEKPELWDLSRPLEGNCKLELLTFEDREGKMVFWHSSAHVLGECLECQYGGKLCIGPPTEEGFYYDAYMGTSSFHETDFPEINKKAEAIAKEKQVFERIVLTKEQALRMFADNPFKVQLISTKIPDGGYTTAYRCGPLIDLCRGPHVPNTSAIKAFEVLRCSSAYWLGSVENDALQRVYGVSFPEPKMLTKYKDMMEKAKQRDHRVLGAKQELFFFHELSPGSCFFLPHGARIYNKLQEHIRNEYRKRGYTEVVTPNMFNLDLWRISGHAEHYLENMFTFKVEGQDYGLKPMNCPGHCLMFDCSSRSYRDLPIRLADFGVLHRNEFSGALTGLTRVRRFQQDDAHIFCRQDQIRGEVANALDFMQHTYGIFGFEFELHLSTRPKKAMGAKEMWDRAEAMMVDALNSFGRKWKLNPGDGAFYGPKIDIKVFDALGRPHQCATIQLDFQLPVRFNLRFRKRDEKKEAAEASGDTAGAVAPAPVAEAKHEHPHAERAIIKDPVAAAIARVNSGGDEDLPEGFERPVIIHRAILGSVERMIAVLIEHTGGKWPFWLSPRQVCIVPVAQTFNDYAHMVRDRMHEAGFYTDVSDGHQTMNKKIREAQLAQYNFILVVGEIEQRENSVNIRTRENEVKGTKPLDEAVAMLKQLAAEFK